MRVGKTFYYLPIVPLQVLLAPLELFFNSEEDALSHICNLTGLLGTGLSQCFSYRCIYATHTGISSY